MSALPGSVARIAGGVLLVIGVVLLMLAVPRVRDLQLSLTVDALWQANSQHDCCASPGVPACEGPLAAVAELDGSWDPYERIGSAIDRCTLLRERLRTLTPEQVLGSLTGSDDERHAAAEAMLADGTLLDFLRRNHWDARWALPVFVREFDRLCPGETCLDILQRYPTDLATTALRERGPTLLAPMVASLDGHSSGAWIRALVPSGHDALLLMLASERTPSDRDVGAVLQARAAPEPWLREIFVAPPRPWPAWGQALVGLLDRHWQGDALAPADLDAVTAQLPCTWVAALAEHGRPSEALLRSMEGRLPGCGPVAHTHPLWVHPAEDVLCAWRPGRFELEHPGPAPHSEAQRREAVDRLIAQGLFEAAAEDCSQEGVHTALTLATERFEEACPREACLGWLEHSGWDEAGAAFLAAHLPAVVSAALDRPGSPCTAVARHMAEPRWTASQRHLICLATGSPMNPPGLGYDQDAGMAWLLETLATSSVPEPLRAALGIAADRGEGVAAIALWRLGERPLPEQALADDLRVMSCEGLDGIEAALADAPAQWQAARATCRPKR